MRRRSRQSTRSSKQSLWYVIGLAALGIFCAATGRQFPVELSGLRIPGFTWPAANDSDGPQYGPNPTGQTPPYSGPAGPLAAGEYLVERVIDGDTIVINGIHLRLLGVDTPETKNGVQKFGPEASDFTKRFVAYAQNRVYVQYDPESKPTDKYGRTLAYVSAGGYQLNEQLVLAGLARVLPDYRFSQYWKDRLLYAQQQAQAQGLGIWSR